jgi:type II secretory pathway pseudopilin PulG
MTHNLPRFPKGFSLIELAVILAISASVGAVLAPALSHSRAQARGMSSEGNLAMIGQIGAMYGLDHDDRIFTFTWRGGEEYLNLKSEKLKFYSNDQQAASGQVTNILQRATGRLRGRYALYTPTRRLMHRRFSHLVLADYMGGNVSDPIWADPADANQLYWQLNPLEYSDDDPNTLPYGNGIPDTPGYDEDSGWADIEIVHIWPFASSYQVVPHAWQQDFGIQYVPLEDTPHLYTTNGFTIPLGERRFHEVRFPSAKVWMHEEFDREQAGSPYFAYDHAQPAKLMFDGSINTAMSGLAASSVSPADYNNRDKFVWEQTYVPLDTFPVPLGGLEDPTLLNMRYRWTLGGLQGIDYPQMLTRP